MTYGQKRIGFDKMTFDPYLTPPLNPAMIEHSQEFLLFGIRSEKIEFDPNLPLI